MASDWPENESLLLQWCVASPLVDVSPKVVTHNDVDTGAPSCRGLFYGVEEDAPAWREMTQSARV